MAQSLSSRHPAGLTVERQQLRLEKVGVIAGFLVGLPFALAEVSHQLADAPEWLSAAAIVLTVAGATRLGLLVASALARRIAR
jgi:CDP-diglyceride synthetase